jgi:hypothetical protein
MKDIRLPSVVVIAGLIGLAAQPLDRPVFLHWSERATVKSPDGRIQSSPTKRITHLWLFAGFLTEGSGTCLPCRERRTPCGAATANRFWLSMKRPPTSMRCASTPVRERERKWIRIERYDQSFGDN